eukprot:scaffold2829_cov147-Amphora_coffeaeformis.AAC.4
MAKSKRKHVETEKSEANVKSTEKLKERKTHEIALKGKNNKKRKRPEEEGKVHEESPAKATPEKSLEKWSKSKKKRMRQLKAKQAEALKATPEAPKTSTSAALVTAAEPQREGDGKSKLQDIFKARLAGSRFRILNEELYTKPSKSSFERFASEPELYEQYHEGFRKQVEQWPVNPVDVMIKSIKSSSNYEQTTVVADFGCGDAEIARQLLQVKAKGGRCPFVVHSFDLVAGNELVTACDMANTPLPKSTVDVAVFCLALMGTNLADFVREAHRVLKPFGRLKIAEVRSRFESKTGKDEIDDFVECSNYARMNDSPIANSITPQNRVSTREGEQCPLSTRCLQGRMSLYDDVLHGEIYHSVLHK